MNLKIRLKNPIFWIQLVGSIVMTALAYNSMIPQDLTTWEGLLGLLKGIAQNPYLIVLCIWNAWEALNDPTTSGVTDSEQALGYEEPKKNGGITL